ncbi:protein GVQW3-like [Hydra vulgaris]|uniref:Protein GVQW3-like n=1 Tax=Hydra vulgaris TaxID=6087 RepID=A0ABM4D049_HYDVU
MSNFVEQRSAIKFCLRNDISAAETYRMLQKAFGEETMSQKNVYKWYKDFKEGRELVDDLERSGRPSTSIDDRHINKIKELVLANRRLTIRDLVDMVGISFGSVQAILKDHLGLRRLKSRLVPKFLNFFEKERRVKMCEAMLSTNKLLLAMRLGSTHTTLKQPTNRVNTVKKASRDRSNHVKVAQKSRSC